MSTKYLILLLFGLSLTWFSCEKNDTTSIYVPLPVIETFKPVMKEISISDIHDFSLYQERIIVVNSKSELPVDDFFDNEEFLNRDIDFSLYSLIIFYDSQIGKILTTNYKWGYNTYNEQFQINIRYDIEKKPDNDNFENELSTYIRGAMLVRQIPATSKVVMLIGAFFVDPK